MTRTSVVNALIGCVLLALLAVLISKTRSVDFDAHGEIVGLLRQLKQVDAEWNVDVLRSRTGLHASYDPVASPLALIDSLENALQTKADQFWHGHNEGSERILPLLEYYKKLMDRKVALIDRFKSQNSILRNSSRYLPLAAADTLSALATVRTSESTQAAQAVEDVLTYALVHVNAPDSASAARVGDGIAQLQQLAPQLPADAAESVKGYVSHAATVVTQQRISGKTLADLIALPTAKAIDDLADVHSQEHDRLLLEQQTYRWLLVGYSTLLLLALAWAAWRLVRSNRMLNTANHELVKTNEELKESQVYMVQAEKMSALGQMVAGIAHEINTPLAYVKGTFEVLREQVPPMADLAANSYQFANLLRVPQGSRNNDEVNQVADRFAAATTQVASSRVMEEMGQLLKDGIHGIEQIAEIVTNLKNFSRLDRARVSEFSLHEGLDSTLLLAKNLLKDRIEVRKEYDADLPKIECSPSQVNQVFLNIITNAVHAMPEERTEPGVITLRTAREGRDMVRVEIQDNGSGIPSDVLPKIFDPFFTTKEIGKGTGMGLSISYKIIQQHGGKILVNTEPGSGTVFSILLPVSERKSKRAARTDALVAA